MRSYPQDIYQYDDWHALIQDEMENIDTHGRRWEVYRQLMMQPNVTRTPENNDLLFNYIRVQRHSIEDFFERFTPFSFELTRDTAMLTLTERKKMYTYFPSQQAVDDILLQLAGLVRDRQTAPDTYGRMHLTWQEWQSCIQELQHVFARGWSKEFREMSTDRLAERLLDQAMLWQLIIRDQDQITILPAFSRFCGNYSDDFERKEEKMDE